MNERIEKLLDEIDMSPSLFADAIGVQRATVSHVLSGRNNPSLDFVQKILSRYPALNPDWILSGKGKIWRDEEGNDGAEREKVPERISAKTHQSQLFEAETGKESSRNKKNDQKLQNAESEDEKTARGVNQQIQAVEEKSGADNEKDRKREIVKVIILYDDQTFEAFTGL